MSGECRIAPGQCVKINVPASSANLGPGYDSMGLALNIQDTVQIETYTIKTGDALRFKLSGEGTEKVPHDETHLIVASMLQCWSYVEKHSGINIIPAGLYLKTENRIPHSRGLGSSAAAIVAGVMGAVALLPEGLREKYEERIFQVASIIEGHPDNIAPAIIGGLSISWKERKCGNCEGGDKSVRCARCEDIFHKVSLEIHPQVIPVVAIPDYKVSTARVRALIPEVVPHKQAALNSAKAALLTHALTAEPALLYAATEDFLHQRYRAEAMLPSAQLVDSLRKEGLAAVISGAGPTVLVLTAGRHDAEEAIRSVQRHIGGDGLRWHVSSVKVARTGVALSAALEL